MAKAEVKLNLRGLNALMKSEGVQRDLDARGQRMAKLAGENFEYVPSPGRYTARGYVQPIGVEGKREEARDKKLTRSIDAGR
jgi:hypothetical protein